MKEALAARFDGGPATFAPGGAALEQAEAIVGTIVGCAVGDAIGLPYEGLSKRRGNRLLGEPDRHRFIGCRGMVSDDTEHICMVAQALCAAPTDPDMFARHLGRGLRWWLLGCPAGIGAATFQATLRLWLGIPPSRSGVYSAGNGPAMRSAVIGVAIDDLETINSFVRASTRITHTDPKAYLGALGVAMAAWCAKRGITDAATYLDKYHAAAAADPSGEFDGLLKKVRDSVAVGDTTEAFAEQIGCLRGVSGYVYRTVPVALHSWLCHPRDFRRAVMTVVKCGGDTDTTAAIVGAVIGSGLGRSGIPAEWQNRVWEWPRSIAWMECLAEAMAGAIKTGIPVRSPPVMPVAGLARNVLFMAVVLCHAVRRLLPPY